MRLLAMTVAACAALTVGADAAQAGEISGRHQATMAVMGPGHAAQATLVRHRSRSSQCSGHGSHRGRTSVVIQRYYSPHPTTIYRSYGYPSHGRSYHSYGYPSQSRSYHSYGYPSHSRSYHSYGHSSGGFYYGGPRFGISIGF